MSRCISGVNDLYTWCNQNGEWGQQLLSEWVGLDEYDNEIDMHSISRGTPNIKVKWRCTNGHIWCASPNQRTARQQGCPTCGYKIVSNKLRQQKISKSLYDWCLENNDRGKQLLNEWQGIDYEQQELDIKKIAYASGIKVLWKCSRGHTWYAAPHDRTKKNVHSCPECCNKQTSYPELFIYFSLKQLFSDTTHRVKLFKNDKNKQGFEYDVFVPSLSLCIEYSPTYWHSERTNRDDIKRQLCIDNNMNFIEIIEDSYNELDETWGENKIVFRMANIDKNIIMKKITNHILNEVGHSISEIDVNNVINNIYRKLANKAPFEQSVLYLYPELAKEWSDKNSLKLCETPICATEVEWKCPNCSNVWMARIDQRAYRKYGCKACGYNWYKKESQDEQKIKNYIHKNDEYSELIKEWSKLNNVNLSDISSSSTYNTYWQCANCGYGSNGEWQAKVARRTAKGYETGCPNCGYNWHRAQVGEPQRIKKKYSNIGFNQLDW